MNCGTLDLKITKGKTFVYPLQWEQSSANAVMKDIAGATQANPCVLNVPAHGMPDGWHFRIFDVKGPTALNQDPDTGLGANGRREYRGKVLSANSIQLPDVRAQSLKAYVSGGSIVYNPPYDLTGYVARMSVKDMAGGTLLLSLTTANGGILLDATLGTVTMFITDAQTAAFDWESAVYDLEMVAPNGAVTELVRGSIEALDEVTT